jgi:hypothetical protein
MIADDTAISRVINVRKSISHALEQWDSSNLPAMSECESILEESAAELQRFQDTAANATPADELRQELQDIKASIDRFIRIVDASSAFVAGVYGLSSDTGVSYDAAGTTRCIGGHYREGQAPCRTF